MRNKIYILHLSFFVFFFSSVQAQNALELEGSLLLAEDNFSDIKIESTDDLYFRLGNFVHAYFVVEKSNGNDLFKIQQDGSATFHGDVTMIEDVIIQGALEMFDRVDMNNSPLVTKHIQSINDLTIRLDNNNDSQNSEFIVENGTGVNLFRIEEGGDAFIKDLEVQGNLHVTGSLSKGGGSFRIDHPLEPENKFK